MEVPRGLKGIRTEQCVRRRCTVHGGDYSIRGSTQISTVADILDDGRYDEADRDTITAPHTVMVASVNAKSS